eukprot:CAMPEP_0171266936 /NCGR_PEP_ID=MMETSP0790-20130122/58901_1 /TAXON_ID=2925 /ORGANISM="Alexandrium catenella, Strain OF101" /LENGTH=50 /DNA_ID=CAMNT_0011735659 /DNA_START=25 /DNA_END=174 /DNA_ORIENTATION=-
MHAKALPLQESSSSAHAPESQVPSASLGRAALALPLGESLLNGKRSTKLA